MPRTLYRLGKFALMFGADIGMLRVHNLRLARDKTPKKIDFFIIDFVYILGAKEALFGHWINVDYQGILRDIGENRKAWVRTECLPGARSRYRGR